MTSSIPTVDEINAMTPTQHKTYENRLRRTAARQGLRLVKSRARDPRALTFGLYALVDDRNALVAGDFTQGLDDIDRYLQGA